MLEAARIGDQVTHTMAKTGAVWGAAIVGALVGVAVVGLVRGTGTFMFDRGYVVVVIGAILYSAGQGSKWGEFLGRKYGVHPVGPIISGSHTVFIGPKMKGAARAHADVAACKDHSPSDTAIQDAGKVGKRIAQGSGTVFIEKFHAARVGDKGTCEFVIKEGCPTVFIGGPTVTTDDIDPEVSEKIHKAQEWAIHKGHKWVIDVGVMILFGGSGPQVYMWALTDLVTEWKYGEGSTEQKAALLIVSLTPASLAGAEWNTARGAVKTAAERMSAAERAAATATQRSESAAADLYKAGAPERAAQAAEQRANSAAEDLYKAENAKRASSADLTRMGSAERTTAADLEKAQEAQRAAAADLEKAQEAQRAAAADLEKAQEAQRAAAADLEKARQEAAAAAKEAQKKVGEAAMEQGTLATINNVTGHGEAGHGHESNEDGRKEKGKT